MSDVCEVCQSPRVTPETGNSESGFHCESCGSSAHTLFSRYGAAFSYPEAWGRLMSVSYETFAHQKPPEGYDDPDGDYQTSAIVLGETYYVFLSKDGVVRRCSIGSDLWPPLERPETLDGSTKEYQYWVVTVIPRGE